MRPIGELSELRITLLGLYGFHGKTIAATVRKYDGTLYSVSTVYRVLKKAGVRLRAYRDGEGDEAQHSIHEAQRRLAREVRGGKRGAA